MLIQGGMISSGRFVHFFRCRFILDELHQVVLENDLARRDGDVLADLERLDVGHADRELALAALEIAQQVLQAFDQVLAAGSRASRAAPLDWS